MKVKGRHVVVTGASRGIGEALARRFAAEGAKVTLVARSGPALHGIAADIDGDVVVADLTDDSVVDGLVERIEREHGPIDVLVNNAGVGTAVPALKETRDQFRDVIDINLNGCYWMSQACGRVMQPGSSIINIASVLALTTAGLPQAAYASSKAGLLGLTRDLAQQWTGRRGIRVNAIAPGFFESEMTDQYADGYLESRLPRIPSGRKGDPRELAATAVFLASPAAGYIPGQTLAVDGGFTIA